VLRLSGEDKGSVDLYATKLNISASKEAMDVLVSIDRPHFRRVISLNKALYSRSA